MTATEREARDASPAEHADIASSTADYAGRFSGRVGAWFLATQSATTLELLRPWPRAKVLDVGGGHGQLVGPLTDAGYEVTVYGSDPVCAERLRPWVDAGRARFASGDLLRAPWPERSFDVVLAFRLLAHVERWREFIAELTRLARYAVVVDYPTRRSVNAVSGALFSLKKSVEKNTRPYRVFSEAEIGNVFDDCGYQATGRRPQFLLPMALHRSLDWPVFSRALESLGASLQLTRLLGSPVILRGEPGSNQR
jgi:2-polyprenyl-3-methyl-5-hydroxy-6-metoxy-1,4-benzoquinol methylase